MKLVDSTGFSLQSIRTVLHGAHEEGISGETWDSASLFSEGSHDLRNMMGVLLRVPELRDNLKAVTGGDTGDGDKLALIVKDWVNGVSVPEIATRHFAHADETKSITVCGKNLYGRLTQTAAWGLGALLSITGSDLSESKLACLDASPRVRLSRRQASGMAIRL